MPSASALVVGSQATVDGSIASIDTKPWTYDGSAVVLLDTATQGRVAVQLPARWNLCKAPPVEVAPPPPPPPPPPSTPTRGW